MNNIFISIWGIRAGFESNGIFHSHQISEVLELQKDKFRSVANSARPKNIYLINRTAGHTVVSLIFTDIKEYAASGSPRAGYVIFSLIIGKNKAFTESPRHTLQNLALWYKTRQANTKANNFTGAQVEEQIKGLTLKDISISTKSGVKYASYNDEQELDNYLRGDNHYAAFSELLLIEKGINFVPDVQLPNQEVSLYHERLQFEEQENLKIQQRQAQERKANEINGLEKTLHELYKAGKLEEMINTFDAFRYKNEVSREIQNKIIEFKQEKERKALKDARDQENQRYAAQIKGYLQSDQIEEAIHLYGLLSDKDLLSIQEKSTIQNALTTIRKQRDYELLEQKNKEDKRRKKRMAMLLTFSSMFFVLILMIVGSIFFEFPLYMYDRDGDLISNREDRCPDEAGKKEFNGCATAPVAKKVDADTTNTNPDGPKEKNDIHAQIDSLKQGKAVMLGKIGENHKLNNNFVKFLKDRNKWVYSADTIRWSDVISSESQGVLNEKFPGVVNSASPRPTEPTPPVIKRQTYGNTSTPPTTPNPEKQQRVQSGSTTNDRSAQRNELIRLKADILKTTEKLEYLNKKKSWDKLFGAYKSQYINDTGVDVWNKEVVDYEGSFTK